MNPSLLTLAFFFIIINFVVGEDDDPPKFEDDIALSKYEMDNLDSSLNDTHPPPLNDNLSRVIPFWTNGYDKRWPGGVMLYTFSKDIDKKRKDVIEEAMAEFSCRTCIRFKPRTWEYSYVEFIKSSGCWSQYIGMAGAGAAGRQLVSIGQGCQRIGTVLHMIMHALGFDHEERRPDRDKYVKINIDNIRAGRENEFLKYGSWDITDLGAAYDYCSIMHSPAKLFAKDIGTLYKPNYLPTIVPLTETECRIGQRISLSETDVWKINTLYKCESITTAATPLPLDRLCSGWAQSGECQNPEYKKFMLKRCAKACKTCENDNCKDKYEKCVFWAEKGFCTGAYEDYMNENCKKSCGISI